MVENKNPSITGKSSVRLFPGVDGFLVVELHFSIAFGRKKGILDYV